jgi:uncharacterized protein YbaR (Trm112 family)
MALSKELLDLVRCPKCRGALTLRDDESGFVCAPCKVLYPIEDGLPNFLIDEARPVD